MASGDWQIILESRAERDLAKLGNPSLIREACAVIDDLQFDPVPPGAVKMGRYNSAFTGLTKNDASSASLPSARAGVSIGAFVDETRFSHADCPKLSLKSSSVHA